VFNVVAYPKLQRSDQLMPVFRGDMYKKGQSIPYSWKKRTFQLTGRKLKYFDKGSYKGEFDIKNCLVFYANLESGGPANCFQFTLVSSILKDNTMECCTCTEYEVNSLSHLIFRIHRYRVPQVLCIGLGSSEILREIGMFYVWFHHLSQTVCKCLMLL
jgi:hypothetical protein